MAPQKKQSENYKMRQLFFFLSFFFFSFILFLNLKHCISFAKHQGSGWGAHVYLWRIRFDVWQN